MHTKQNSAGWKTIIHGCAEYESIIDGSMAVRSWIEL